MESIDQLKLKVREWVKTENEIKVLQKELNKRRKDKHVLSNDLIAVMRLNGIDNLDIQNGQICYSKTTTKKPINQKTLLNLLSKYFDGNEEQALRIGQYVYENREQIEKESLKMKMNASSGGSGVGGVGGSSGGGDMGK
jgi:hypothetical protein